MLPDAIETRQTRRQFLSLGALGAVLGIAAVVPGPKILSAEREVRSEFTRLLYIANCGGGPSGPDSFDVRESSTEFIHQIFSPIDTSIPGMRVTHLFPRIAERVKKIVFLRNCTTVFDDHYHAIAASLGRDEHGENLIHRTARKAPGFSRGFFAETPGCINGSNYRGHSYGVDHCLELKWESNEPMEKRMMADEFFSRDMPGEIYYTFPPGMKLDAGEFERLSSRVALRNLLQQESLLHAPPLDRWKAMEPVVQELLRKMVEITDHVDPREIDRYSLGGKHLPISVGIATMMMLFREGIISAGLLRNGYNPHDFVSGGFDMHKDVKKGMQYLGPRIDHAIAMLMDDIESGKLADDRHEHPMLFVGTEFGREPKLNDDHGRDHWKTGGQALIVSPKLEGGIMIGSMDDSGKGLPGRKNGEINEADRSRILWELLKPESEADRAFRSQFPQIFERVHA